MHPLVERIDTALNPLMVKEAHQSFRNRMVIGVGVLALGVPLLVFGFTLVGQTYGNSETEGDGFFGLISGFYALIAFLAVPARAAQQFQSEIKSRTIDLILLTGLSPWDLASGRFQAAGLQLVVMLAFVVPFAVASTVMGGIGLERVLPSLLFVLLLGLAQCAAALLAVSTMLVSRRLGAAALLIFVMQMVFFFSTAMVLVNSSFVRRTPELLAWAVLLIVLATLLFLRLSADMLTPGAARTYARSKLIMLALVAAFFVPPWLTAAGASLASPSSSIEHSVLLVTGLTWFVGFALLWSAAAPRPRSGGRLGPVFANGSASTGAYAVITILFIGGISQVRGWAGWIALPYAVYFVYFVGLAALIQTFWFVRTSEGFFAGMLLCCVLSVLATAVYEAQHSWGATVQLPPLAVFLPMLWPTEVERVLSPWFALPALVGGLAMYGAYRRRAKIEHE